MDLQRTSADLCHACNAGTEPERTTGYRRLGEILHRVAWQHVAHDARLHPLAEEAMQESLVIVWRHLAAGRGPEPAAFVAWATVIVVNKVREAVRRLEPTTRGRPTLRVALSRQVRLDAPDERTGELLSEHLAQDGGDMDESLAYQELCALVAGIQDMPEISDQSRTVLLRGYIEGLSDAELAEQLATSRANVHVIRCRDLARLRNVPAFMAQLRQLRGEEA
jgi:RNA polymerase sigma factor (sigma-70 family)